MSEHKNLVLFDFDGVIVNTYDMCFDIMRTLNPALKDTSFRAYSEKNFLEAILSDNLATGNDITDFTSEYDRRLHAHHRPEDMVDECLRALANRYPLFIVSSTPTAIIKKFLAVHDLESCFREILGSDVHANKTKKIGLILSEYRAAPDDCVFITDTLGDIREAEAAGVKSIAVTWGCHPKETLERGKPIAIVGNPRKLVTEVNRFFSTKRE